jgi:sulfur-oxidizing protein SoxY
MSFMKKTLDRREMLTAGAGLAVLATPLLRALPALADAAATEARMMAFTGGKMPETGMITLTAPEIAENGNTVPISIEVDSSMTEESHVEEVIILAENNPNPDVATFHFTTMSGVAAASTRMRLAETQNVIAVAKMNDGSVFMDKKEVKVTIGGCGG